MSSDRLENLQDARPTVDRLLVLLKTGGPQSTADLGAALGVSAEAARQQLVKLAENGLVAAQTERHGVGRPLQRWSLTAAGNARFPDRHAETMVQLLGLIRRELGESGLDRVIDARARESRAVYAAALKGAADLGERVARLAAIRTKEGYMAEWQTDGADYVLIENHCPICAAATACQGFCRAELELFSWALGPGVSIERTEHIIAGARRCVYRIRRMEGKPAPARRRKS
jgi:predicted ArsR family transcriptional regulator